MNMNENIINSNNNYSSNQEDEISLIDLIAVLLKYKLIIIIVTLSAMIFSIVISVISLKMPAEKSFLPNKYRPYATMLIKESSKGGISSMLAASPLGALAGAAGVSGGSTLSALALYLCSSNLFLDSIIDNFDILSDPEIQKAKFPKTSARNMIKNNLKAEFDEETGIFKISYLHIDPVFAQSVVNYSVNWLDQKFDDLGVDEDKISKENLEKNIASSFEEIKSLQKRSNQLATSVSNGTSWSIPSIALENSRIAIELSAQTEVYKQLKTQYELLKAKMQGEAPVFQILERPEIPEIKSEPRRGKLCIIISFAAFFFSVFIVFLINAWNNIKNDPDAMKKLNIKKK